MIFTEVFAPALIWILILLVLAGAWLPVSLRLFSGLPCRGVLLSLPLGVFSTTLLVWLFGQEPLWAGESVSIWRGLVLGLGAFWTIQKLIFKQPFQFYTYAVPVSLIIFGIIYLPFVWYFVWSVVVLAGVINWLYFFDLKSDLEIFKDRKRIVFLAIGFALFFSSILLFALIRSYTPEITYKSAEKMGNFMHLNSILRASAFPPEDAWAIGFRTNYYYVGHLTVAVPTLMSGLRSSITFNLGLCQTLALSLVTAFSLGLALIEKFNSKGRKTSILFQTIAALFFSLSISVFGNLDALVQTYELDDMYGSEYSEQAPLIYHAPFIGRYSALLLKDDQAIRGFDYWRSSRAIHSAPEESTNAGTITEFPAFSLLLGDLHPHHLASPYLLFALTVLFAFFIAERSQFEIKNGLSILLGILTAGLFVMNSWDALVMIVLLGVFWTLRFLKDREAPDFTYPIIKGFGFLLVVLPFLLVFQKPTSTPQLPWDAGLIEMALAKVGLGILNPILRTTPLEYTIHFWPVVLILAVLCFRKTPYLIGFCALLASFLLFSFPTVLILLGVFFCVWGWKHMNSFTLALLLVFIATTAGVELIYIDDYYSGEYERYNTLFKFYYSCWPIAWTLFFMGFLHLKLPSQIALGIFSTLVGMIYPSYGIATRIVSSETEMQTLNGLLWMKDSPRHSGDYELYEWAWNLGPQNARIAEATPMEGIHSYSEYGRLAAITGYPSLNGWTHHEYQWRGWTAEVIHPFDPERPKVLLSQVFEENSQLATRIYTVPLYLSDDLKNIRERGIQFVIVSNIEQLRYSATRQLLMNNPDLTPIYETENLVIFEVQPTL